MKHFYIPTLLIAGTLALASCYGDEPANSECDIERAWVHMDDPNAIFFHMYDTLYTVPSTQEDIVFSTRYDAVVTKVPISFTITAKATMFRLDENKREVPFVNGDVVDFSNGQIVTFRVRSESGEYHRDYNISIKPKTRTGGDMYFDFDNNYYLDQSGFYYRWKQPDAPSPEWWDNGNPGFRLSVSSATPLEYPTTPDVKGGIDGKGCIKLTTCSTGGFGEMVNMRIAAGNMFIGTFDVENALKDALAATQMGRPFAHKPIKISGYYKFQPGAVKQDKNGNTINGEKDYPDIYCVVYKNVDDKGNQIQLDGNLLDTDKSRNPYVDYIVGKARIKSEDIDLTNSQWVKFELPVVYTKDIDQKDVENELYSTAIVFSSSVEGAYFRGAIGSTLWIDNVTLECEY